MTSIIDFYLNRITMYRLMLYYLIVLVVLASFFGSFGFLPYTFKDLLLSTAVVLGIGYISNYLFSKIFKAQTNIESVFITGLILVLIMPVSFPQDFLFLSIASFVAMASKYIFAFNKRHIFNPAAIAAVTASFAFGFSASWWIGSMIMLPFLVLGGFLILRKTQREKLAMVFISVFLLIVGIGAFISTHSFEAVFLAWQVSLIESALPFFVFVMLIEPATSPTRKHLQVFYAFIVSLFYAVPQVGIMSIAITPEIALCIGNLASYFISPNYRLELFLKDKLKLSKDAYMFVFEKQKNFNFLPGQYMEWTLPHKNADSRGNRRFFTISSSPTEKEITVTVKFYDQSSTYKKELFNLQNKKIIASYVSGDFIFPSNLNMPMVFIAGGVGITPFRSMVQYIVDKNQKADIILIYLNKTKEEILFQDVFKKAEKNGVKTIYFLTNEKGHLNKDGIKSFVPDFQKRIYYLSGPQLMVRNFEKMLIDMKISKFKIKTDFFPGYEEG